MKLWARLRRGSRRIFTTRSLLFLASLAVLAGVIVTLTWSPPADPGVADEPARAERAIAERARAVTVISTSAASHAARIDGLAEVRPRWSSTLKSVVDGVLLEVSSELQPGARVSAGQVLAVVDPTAWQANLAEAENRLALAELNLLREQQEGVEARASWRESGLPGEPDSSLVLRAPQIDAAQGEVAAARAARDWATRQLEYTRIRAPFAGIVAARHVSRGESILPGEPIVEIVATHSFELALQVSPAQWRNLPEPVVGTVAELIEPEGAGRWRATVTRVGNSFDPTTRLRTLYLTVPDPLAGEVPLLPGAFVRVRISGRQVERTLELPESALTRSGHVWYVDGEDTLRRYAAAPLFTRPGRIYIPQPGPASSWRIVQYPLDSFMVGQTVRAVADGAGDTGKS
ncbi:MAG: efflux RND transporter periplasmic adaptor subunit [Acidobacteriota bacterium]